MKATRLDDYIESPAKDMTQDFYQNNFVEEQSTVQMGEKALGIKSWSRKLHIGVLQPNC